MKKSLLMLIPSFLFLSCGGDDPVGPKPPAVDGCLGTYAGQLPTDFTASGYAEANSDLVAAFCGGNCAEAAHCDLLALHYIEHGQAEGRGYTTGTQSSGTESSSSGTQRSHRVGFLPYYGKQFAKDIDYSRYTQINFFSVKVNADGSINDADVLSNPNYEMMSGVIAAARSAGLPIWYTIGGSNRSQNMSAVFSDPSLRAVFVNAAVAYAQLHNYQGIDIDWEFPTTDGDAVALTETLRALHEAASPVGLGLSVDIPTHLHLEKFKSAKLNTDFADYVDMINVMTYDYTTLNELKQNDPAAMAIETIDYLLGRGLPANKLNFGIAFYGKNCIGGVPCKDMTWSDWYGISRNQEWTGMQKPYIADETDRTLKADYIATKHLAGVLYWEITHDVPFSDPDFPLPSSTYVTYRIAAWWDDALTARGM